jgi:hypothetical protein
LTLAPDKAARMPDWSESKSFGKWLKTRVLRKESTELGPETEEAKSPAHWMIVNVLTGRLSDGERLAKGEEPMWTGDVRLSLS